jgi:VanZ family protein
MTRTGISGHIEHAIAYGGTALMMALAYGERVTFPALALLVLYAGSLEFLQQFSPGRVASMADFAFGAAGTATGILVSVALRRLVATYPAPSKPIPPT